MIHLRSSVARAPPRPLNVDPLSRASAWQGRPQPSRRRRMHSADKPAVPVARIRSVIQRLMAEGSMIARADGSTRDVRSVSITAGEGEALARGVLRENARRTIEIG